jgi:hypothetical protein
VGLSLVQRERIGALFLAAALSLIAFHLIGVVFFGGFALDLGSLNVPTPRYVTLVAFWTMFGGLSAVLFALAISGCAGSGIADRLVEQWQALPDRRFLMWTSAAAFAIPMAIRFWVLRGAPLADDESAYRFAAELLASGRLWVASPHMKLFFDQNFMINDGRLYPVYFLGWPVLLAVGVIIHAPGIVNPLLAALTVPALFRVCRHFAGAAWARGGILLFLSAPFLQIAAATELSHTSCLMALTWALAMCLRSREADATLRHHAGFAFSFALAVCIRPQSAVPLGLPLLVFWGLATWRLRRPERLRAGVAFLIPAALLASLFLGSIWAQNGSPWRSGYARSAQYVAENGFRFTTFTQHDFNAVAGFDFSDVGGAIARTALGMFRLNSDLFGWPSSLALILLALPTFSAGALLWWMAASFLLPMMFQSDWGIDTFGPVHAFELALPILVLTIVGARNLDAWLVRTRSKDVEPTRWPWPALSPSLLGAFIATAWLGFVPVRLDAVRRIAEHLNTALQAPELAGIHQAVIFAPWPFAPRCNGVPAHFVFFRPVNDPDLHNDILWVNNLDVEQDRRFLQSLSGRTGYGMIWTSGCGVRLLPLAASASSILRPARTR